jgi:hypothetical protein
MCSDEPSVHESEGIAKQEIGENFDDVADKVKLVTLFEEFDEEEDKGSKGVDRKWEQLEHNLPMISRCLVERDGGEKEGKEVDHEHGPLSILRHLFTFQCHCSPRNPKRIVAY